MQLCPTVLCHVLVQELVQLRRQNRQKTATIQAMQVNDEYLGTGCAVV
jgi:hypothetical protein